MSRGAMYSTNIGKANKHASTRQLLAVNVTEEPPPRQDDASLDFHVAGCTPGCGNPG